MVHEFPRVARQRDGIVGTLATDTAPLAVEGVDARRAEIYDPTTDRWTLADSTGVDVLSPSPVVRPVT